MESDLARAVYWLSWINFAKLAGAFLVAIGVSAEFIAEYAGRPFEQTIEHARSAEIEEAKAETAKANAEIARLKAPRSLTDEYFLQLVERLKPFAGDNFNLGVNVQDGEAFALAQRLSSALNAAGITWQQTVWQDALAVSGIEIQFVKNAPAKKLEAGKQLIEGLRDAGLIVNGPRLVDVGNPTFFVYLIVGRKPG